MNYRSKNLDGRCVGDKVCESEYDDPWNKLRPRRMTAHSQIIITPNYMRLAQPKPTPNLAK